MSRALAILTALFALVLLAPRAARAADAGASANESTVSVVPSVQVRVRTVGRAVRVTGWARSDVIDRDDNSTRGNLFSEPFWRDPLFSCHHLHFFCHNPF